MRTEASATMSSVLVLVAAGTILAGEALAEFPEVPSLHVPSAISDAMRVLQHVDSDPKGPLESPRMMEAPQLTGTEAITLAAFRSVLRAQGPYGGMQTAQEVLDFGEEASREGHGLALKFALIANGLGVLRANWAHAILLGDAAKACNYLREVDTLWAVLSDIETMSSLAKSSDFDVFGTDSPLLIPEIVKEVNLVLRYPAMMLAHSSSSLTDALDPHGFVRQQLDYSSAELRDFAEFITALR